MRDKFVKILSPLGPPPRERRFTIVAAAPSCRVIRTNGLTVYLSGDTGITSDMETVVNRFFHANLAVINISDTFVTGPEEAAFAIRNLIRPNAVIPSHANEVATTGGVVNAGTRTARFIELVQHAGTADAEPAPAVFVPRSGVTLEFDGQAQCQAGCSER